MTHEYITTHTPRQIAQDNTLEEIEQSIPKSYDGFDIFCGLSPEEYADSITGIDDCKLQLEQWKEESDDEPYCEPEELQYLYQVLTAHSLKSAF